MKGMNSFLVTFSLLALVSTLASASDPSSLQDFCVALNGTKHAVFVNGKFCKDPKLVTEDDFFFSGLDKAGNTSNAVGSRVTPANVDQIPGLNTLGISFVRIDYAPNGGLNPPHTHPRATEILVVTKGKLHVGFVTSNPDNRLFTKVLKTGDVFVFPVGLIHFQFNIGKTNAIALAGLSSQNPGVITIANAVFGSKLPINPDVLTKAFKLDKEVVEYLQTHYVYTIVVVNCTFPFNPNHHKNGGKLMVNTYYKESQRKYENSWVPIGSKNEWLTMLGSSDQFPLRLPRRRRGFIGSYDGGRPLGSSWESYGSMIMASCLMRRWVRL
ncbi:hypothetical protein CXB51_028870 [Gossypium anomalum]|uniref:Cupin type-1 domain-containing protein n=1 Tax=Gossypium anomalum TaxID=47600 RepID=A0A8J5Y7W1_9ROSI|nr:hypothetical protein CXB51_028870 [Gossypium anomalum]